MDSTNYIATNNLVFNKLLTVSELYNKLKGTGMENIPIRICEPDGTYNFISQSEFYAKIFETTTKEFIKGDGKDKLNTKSFLDILIY